MITKQKIALIGAGNMGLAITKCLLRAGCLAENLTLCDSNTVLVKKLKNELLVNTSTDNKEVQQADIIILAVKPQQIAKVCQQLTITAPSLVVSIAAGISTAQLGAYLANYTQIVRLMPNMAVSLGVGAVGAYATLTINQAQKALADELIDAMGVGVWVDNEDKINVITALSGSGPAYFFYMVEALSKGGAKLGLPLEDAYKLAVQTIKGATSMLSNTSANLENCQQLRQQITSHGGTTMAAIEKFNRLELDKKLISGVEAAYKRALELI